MTSTRTGKGNMSWQAARNWASLRTPGAGGAGKGRMSGLDNGPIQAKATRMGMPTGAPGLPGRPPMALPGGGAGGAGGPSAAAHSQPGSAGTRTATPPMAAQRTGRPGAAGTRPTIVDPVDRTVARNVAANQTRAGRTGRVWVAQSGSGLSSLDNPTSPPRPAAQRRGGYRITTARGPRES
jgi:hypothetical protein